MIAQAGARAATGEERRASARGLAPRCDGAAAADSAQAKFDAERLRFRGWRVSTCTPFEAISRARLCSRGSSTSFTSIQFARLVVMTMSLAVHLEPYHPMACVAQNGRSPKIVGLLWLSFWSKAAQIGTQSKVCCRNCLWSMLGSGHGGLFIVSHDDKTKGAAKLPRKPSHVLIRNNMFDRFSFHYRSRTIKQAL